MVCMCMPHVCILIKVVEDTKYMRVHGKHTIYIQSQHGQSKKCKCLDSAVKSHSLIELKLGFACELAYTLYECKVLESYWLHEAECS